MPFPLFANRDWWLKRWLRYFQKKGRDIQLSLPLECCFTTNSYFMDATAYSPYTVMERGGRTKQTSQAECSWDCKIVRSVSRKTIEQTHSHTHTHWGLMEPINRRYHGLETSQAVQTPPPSPPHPGGGGEDLCECVSMRIHHCKNIYSPLCFTVYITDLHSSVCVMSWLTVSGPSHRKHVQMRL